MVESGIMMVSMNNQITRILNAVDHGDPRAADELLPLVYEELRTLAAARLASERPGQTLQATALVHEAYMRLLGPQNEHDQPQWDGRGHFFAAAATAMRRILIDRARSKNADKRGGSAGRLSLDLSSITLDEVPAEIIDLDDALEKLALESPEKANLVNLRFFAGLTLKESAAILGISHATADRHWAYARAWLYREIYGAD